MCSKMQLKVGGSTRESHGSESGMAYKIRKTAHGLVGDIPGPWVQWETASNEEQDQAYQELARRFNKLARGTFLGARYGIKRLVTCRLSSGG